MNFFLLGSSRFTFRLWRRSLIRICESVLVMRYEIFGRGGLGLGGDGLRVSVGKESGGGEFAFGGKG